MLRLSACARPVPHFASHHEGDVQPGAIHRDFPSPDDAPNNGGHSQGYDCPTAAAAMFAVTAAAAIVGLKGGPLGILMELEFWAAFGTYSVVAATLWSGVHIKDCVLG